MADIRKRTGKKGVRYQVRYPDPQAQSGYSYKSFDTRKEAIAFREDARGRVNNGSMHPEIEQVPQGVRLWLDICEKEGRNGREPVTKYTLANYEYRARIMCAYPWGKGIRELNRPDVVRFRSWLIENHSRDVAHKVLSSFHSMMLELVSRGILDRDVSAGVRVGAQSRYDAPVSVPSEKEIQELLSAADRLANSRNLQTQRTWERYRPMLYLAVDSGMRPQEYVAAARSNLFETGIEVDRAIDGGGTEITVTKTRAGRRFIDLSPHTIELVRHYADHHAVKNDHDLIFPTSDGTWQCIRNWRRRGFSRACEEAGLMIQVEENGKTIERPKYRPYDLRHFYASMLIDQRVNLKRIQTLMGHRSIQTTLNVYGHLIERAEAETRQRTSVLTCMGRDSCGESVAKELESLDV